MHLAMDKRTLFVFVILSLNMKAEALFKMTNIACTDLNNSIATVELCRLKAVKRDVVEATVKFRLLQKLERVFLHVKLLRKYNTYEPFVINGTLDVCAFFRNKERSPLKVLYKLIEKFTNVNHTCPFEHEIFINRFIPEHDNLMLPLPTGDYLILFGFYVPKNLMGYLRVWFTFHEVKTFKNKNLPKNAAKQWNK